MAKSIIPDNKTTKMLSTNKKYEIRNIVARNFTKYDILTSSAFSAGFLEAAK